VCVMAVAVMVVCVMALVVVVGRDCLLIFPRSLELADLCVHSLCLFVWRMIPCHVRSQPSAVLMRHTTTSLGPLLTPSIPSAPAGTLPWP
jgi:hypothetical protein